MDNSCHWPGLRPIEPMILVRHMACWTEPNPIQFAAKHNLDPIRVTLLFSGSITLFWHELCEAFSAEMGVSLMSFYAMSRRYSDNLSPTPATSALALSAGAFFFISGSFILLKLDGV